MTVGELCNRDVIVSPETSTVTECAQLMREHHVGSVVIVKTDDGVNTPVGIVTDRDIVIELIARESATDQVTASDLISNNLITAREIDSLWETMQRMRNHGIRRIPVVNDEGVLVGILTADDLMEYVTAELNQLVKLVQREQTKEVNVRSIP